MGNSGDSEKIGTWKKLLEGNSKLKSSEQVKVYGAASIELWIKSWNASHPNELLYATYDRTVMGAMVGNGYVIGTSENSNNLQWSGGEIEDQKDNLYFNHSQGDTNNPSNYWLGAPSAMPADYQIMTVSCSRRAVEPKTFYTDTIGCRAIVSMPTNLLTLKKEGTSNTWKITQ